MNNNVISINHRRRHQVLKSDFYFLKSDFYLHNRKENFEEKILVFGGLIMPLILFISISYFGIISFAYVLIVIQFGVLIGMVRSYVLPYKVETYFGEDILPKTFNKENDRRRKSA